LPFKCDLQRYNVDMVMTPQSVGAGAKFTVGPKP
jgi:hypothetical protein